ncbi:putative baseplate assembly protein [Massilia sp. P8910]|uniref:putative baseplate assembly protein n=1 Tax=Massilia antarctica TaxID=2765360 RepID=UPI001E46F5FC|nr:putative baseplate assembly protein [Massilia antarctica]MCE3603665.1 putative baseplate assembly protein [Massilia antarctica]
MPLNAREPKFDRPFEEIFRELRERIPRYNPQWTNFNDSDPGITLLQLFAWLAEMNLHRMGEVPRKTYLKFAQLLGLELHAPRPATVRLVFTPKPSERPRTIPAGARYAARAESGNVVFETTQALDLIGAALAGMFVLADGTIRRAELPTLPEVAPFWPLGRNPVAGDALYLAFKPNPNNQQPFPLRMRFLALRPAADTDGAAQRAGAPERALVPPVDLVWEYAPNPAQDNWERLIVFHDDTVALTRDGYIDVAGPREIEPGVLPAIAAQLPAPHYWLRLRIDQNNYPQGRAPYLDLFLPNAVDAVNLTTEGRTELGESSGRAEQTFLLPRRPVDAGSLRIEVTLASGALEADWLLVEDFFASKKDDKHFMLNAAAGSISFGDGALGLIPAAGARIAAAVWRHGGGAAGNAVMAGAVKTMVDQIAGIEKVANPRAATGGADEQDLDDFIRKAPGQLRSERGAVTANDFELHASAIGGVRKARALGGRHPDYPDVEVPGAVTVFIVADTTRMPPRPSAELIRSVCRVLDKKRLITTEVYVAAPLFLEVRVEVRLLVAPEAAFDQVALAAIERIDLLLNPARRGFGEDLSPAALYAALLRPDDPDQTVRSVENLVIYLDGQQQDVRRPIKVRPDALVYPGKHLIVARPDPDEWGTQ